MKPPIALGLAIIASFPTFAQPSQPPLPESERTRWFQEAKFGVFIHWGVYAVIGRHEWARHRFQIPQAEYDKFIPEFNPVRFDAGAWADLAKTSGARYMVITSKHHDGFSIFRSQVSDYDMDLTPYRGDPLKQLADACKRKGIRLGFYHSIMDWRHPDYRPRRTWEAADPQAGGNLNRYLDFMKEQLRELLTGYGDVAMIWFDGEWEHSTADMRSDEMYDSIRKLQPNTLINDRLYKREPGNRADFGTPEQFVPATGMRDPSGKPVLWEACVTINNDSWGYNKYETVFKTERDLIRMLVEVVSKGGNLLLNVGPMPDGRIQDEFVTRLNAIGRWMRVNQESIYGTTASPFAHLPFYGRATVKGQALYLHVFQWPADGRLRVPGLKNNIVRARLLADPAARLTTERDGNDAIVRVPARAPDEVASVIALELDGSPVVETFRNRPDAEGRLVLGVESAEILTSFGQRAKLENALGHVFLTNWTRAEDIPAWTVETPREGHYRLEAVYAAGRRSAETGFEIVAGARRLSGRVSDTGGEWVFKSHDLGEIELGAGVQTIQMKAAAQGGIEAMNLAKLVLTPR
ncbi:MAG: alpha-L-fucosidase [Bryobacterales bacterium]|nr:alpha-L-fucosidase [Bryobacterales bacterium]